jgi:MFS family permease
MSNASAQFGLSVFILGFAVGRLILAPLTELYGRRPVWLLAELGYSVWNIVAGFANNKSTLIAARFFSGVAGSIDFVVSFVSPFIFE